METAKSLTLGIPPCKPGSRVRAVHSNIAERSDVRRELAAVAREIEPSLYRVALHLCRDVPDARDLVQDTFERALCNVASYKPGTNPQAWLTRIMRNLFIDRCRKQSARPRRESLDNVVTIAREPEPEPIWASITTADLQRAAALLPTEFRQVFEMRTYENRSYDEIAQCLGIPRATVATRLRRARKKLRVHLLAIMGGEAAEHSLAPEAARKSRATKNAGGSGNGGASD